MTSFKNFVVCHVIILFLYKKQPVSNASRNVSYFKLSWITQKCHKRLTYRKKSNAGRSSLTGQTIIWTKKALTRRVKLQSINYSLRSTSPGFISSFSLVPFSAKLISLVIYASGSQTYLPNTPQMKMFSFITMRGKKKCPSYIHKFSQLTLIYLAPAFRKVSNLELLPGKGVQYARSAGSSAKVININKSNHTALVKLPSGVRKFFSIYSTLYLGPAALKLKRKAYNTRSGFWRSHGLKPKVRGVARNPVDHPHGGRTKAIRYPRTPWGKTTKYK